MAKILLVEDDEALCIMLESFLEAEKHTVDTVSNGTEGLERISFYSYDIIVLDWELPGYSGVEICTQFRQKGGTTPILMLTGKNAVRDKKEGLDSGADDYLTKPFHMDELSARVRALLRRAAGTPQNKLVFDDLVLDLASGSVVRGGDEIHLLPKEFALLEFFLRHPDQTFTADVLIARVWSTDSEASPEIIRPYINRLRSKLDVPGRSSLIETSRGRGYIVKSARKSNQ